MTVSSRISLVALLLAAGLVARPAAAAESYDNCTGFIDSLPATISTQGVWCLRKNLGTNITTGNAIRVAANNVTIDCNNFKVGGLAAGASTEATGIYAPNRQNVTVRQCSVRGFAQGIYLYDGAGHLVEDNRLDNNLQAGIVVQGYNSRTRRNAVYDTGGYASGITTWGILARGDIIDNTISGMFVEVPGIKLVGIDASIDGSQIRGNQISGLDSTLPDGGSVNVIGIRVTGLYARLSGNQVTGDVSATPYGTGINSFFSTYCLDNTVGGFATNIQGTCTGTGNETRP